VAREVHVSLPALVGERLQRTSTLVDGLGYALSGERIFLPDVLDNSEKVFGGGCPAKLHLLAEHLIDASADLFVCQELSSVELLQASCHLLAEPGVVVHVVLHKLLDVFLRAALVLGSGPLHFRLQLG
jgi:hypothetical protein